MSQQLILRGHNGETIVLTDGVVSKWRHNGMQEVARNLATTYRSCEVSPLTKGLFNKKPTGDLMVSLVCGSIFGLIISETDRPALRTMVQALEACRDAASQMTPSREG